MKTDFPKQAATVQIAGRRRSTSLLAALALLAAGCAQIPEPARSAPAIKSHGAEPLLAYYQSLGPMSSAELVRERGYLATLPSGPENEIRLAMVIGHPHGQADIARALALIEQTLRSNEPVAVELHPLARVLADQYSERLRLDSERLRLDGERTRLDSERARQEGQLERQAQLLKESQRKAQELQEKLNSLADIERSLAPRPRVGQGGQ